MKETPKLLRMREGKDGGGKGPLVTDNMSLTLTSQQDVLFQPDPGPTPPSSVESEESILDSKPPAGEQFPSARSKSTPPGSSPSDGRGSPTSETSPDWWVTSGEEMIDGSGYHRERIATDVTPTLNGYSTPLVGRTPSSGPEASHAKTSPSLDDGRDSQESEADSPSPSLTFWTDTEMSPSDGSFSKTFKGSSLHMADGIWLDSSVRWGNSGMGGPTEAWTDATSMCRSVGSECSSSDTQLADILISEAPQRFSLSARAAEGILRRASKRGRALPPVLEAALREVCERNPKPATERTVTTTSSATESQPTEPPPHEQSLLLLDTTDMPSEPKTQTEDSFKSVTETGTPTPSQPSGHTAEDPQEMSTTTSSTVVRRLTPLETELLMGWPPGHTISRTYSRRGSTGTD